MLPGYIERVGPDRVEGWVEDPAAAAPARPVFLLLEDVVFPLELTVDREDLVAAGVVREPRCGFSLELAAVLERWREQRSAPAAAWPAWIAVAVGGDVVIARNLPDPSHLSGALIGLRDGRIEGWVSRGDVPDPVEVDIDIDGIALARAVPVIVKDRRGNDARRWFSVLLPLTRFDAAAAEIACRIALTGGALPGSPAVADLRDAAPEPSARAAPAVLRSAPTSARISVVVPVFGAAAALERCLACLLRNTTRAARLVLIDDAGRDGAVDRLLDGVRGRANVVVQRNERNLGFTSTINRGIELAGSDDVVLLNSDAFVPPRWLETLTFAARTEASVGTVTPLSDNAGPFSVPEAHGLNPLPPEWSADDVGRAVTQAGLGLFPESPTAHGFCMFVRRACLDEVGPFDAAAFPRGYGSENDFSMRALRSGWRHVVDDRTIVLHARSASTGSRRRRQLSAESRAVLGQRFPEYATLVRHFAEDPGLAAVRYRVRRAFRQPRPPRPRILTVIATQSGGTPQTNEDLGHALLAQYDVFILRCDGDELVLWQLAPDGKHERGRHRLRQPVRLAKHFSAEYDEHVAAWLTAFAIELVHIRHIAWHGLGLAWVCRALDVPVVFSFHDYYTVCPSLKLLDETLAFCGGACTAGPGPCRSELWLDNQLPPLKHDWVHVWRRQTADMFQAVDAFVTTSVAARAVIVQNFPELRLRRFAIIPHGRDFPAMQRFGQPPADGETVRLLAPGNLSEAKGAEIVAAIAAAAPGRRLEIHVLGEAATCLIDGPAIRHGPYARDDVLARIGDIRPHLGLILSVWPETHCHTLTELWAAGIPVIGFDLGAVGERIRQHGGGWLIERRDAAAVLDAIMRILRDPDDYRARLQEIAVWQQSAARIETTAAMAAGYAQLYADVFARRLAFPRQADRPAYAEAEAVVSF